jgi:hypothetical protein
VAGPKFGHFTRPEQPQKVTVANQGGKVSPSLVNSLAKDLGSRGRLYFWGEIAFELLHVEPLNVSRETMQA